MTAHPWRPPVFSDAPGALALWNAVVSYAGQTVPLKGKNQSAVVQLSPAPEATAGALVVQFSHGPTVAIVLTAFPFRAMFGAELAVADFPALPDALREALEDGVVAAIAGALPDHDLGEAKIVARGPAQPMATALDGEPHWFTASLQGLAPEPIAFQIGCTVAALVNAFAGAAPRPRAIWSGLKAQLTKQAYFNLGALRLQLTELRALTPGAVIVLGADASADEARVRVDGAVFAFRESDEGWICTLAEAAADGWSERAGLAPMTEGIMDLVRTRIDDSTAQELTLASLDIVIDFDLGAVAVPLAEIESWQVGSLVALEPPATDGSVEVTLRANGKIIGAGDLVQIDDRVAVRISKLFFRGG